MPYKWKAFGILLKKHRHATVRRPPNPKAKFTYFTHREIADLLAIALPQGTIYADQTISAWETGREHAGREVVLALIQILQQYNGLHAPEEADALLEAADHRALNSRERTKYFAGGSPPPPPPPPLSSPPPFKEVTFTNVWYLPIPVPAWEYSAPLVGTLSIKAEVVIYETDMGMLEFREPLEVTHTRRPGDFNNNWARLHYWADERLEAWFADARFMGIGNLIGGSHEIFEALKYWVEYRQRYGG